MPPAADPAPILATAVLPWTPRLEFDEMLFRRQVRTLATGLTRHLYVFGTAGEGYAVTDRQFDHVAQVFRDCAGEHGVSPMLGIISLSLPTIIRRIERGHELGYRLFQLSLPSWGALNDRELDTFFAETCGRFADCRFHHYNLLRTKRLLGSAEYARLADAHPNFVAVKAGTSDPAVIADLLKVAPRLRFFFTEIGYIIARRTHDVGLLISLASVNHARAREFVAGDAAQREAALPDFEAMIGLVRELAARGYHMDGAFDKMLYRMHDPEFPLRLLPPYATASEADWLYFRDSLPPRWKPAV